MYTYYFSLKELRTKISTKWNNHQTIRPLSGGLRQPRSTRLRRLTEAEMVYYFSMKELRTKTYQN